MPYTVWGLTVECWHSILASHFASRQACAPLLTLVQEAIEHCFIRSVLHSQFLLEFYGLFQELPVVVSSLLCCRMHVCVLDAPTITSMSQKVWLNESLRQN